MTNSEQIEKLYQEEQSRMAFATTLKNILQTVDLENIKTKTTQTYNRENLRTYLKNPATDANNKNLRKLSNYLYTISHVYRRMVNFKANQITLTSWTALPITSLITEENDNESILQEYNRVCRIVNNMHMETQIAKIMLQAWKNGVCYCFVYGDPETDGTFYLHTLDPDYCRISGMAYESGVYQVAFDFSYFNTYPEQLEYYDKEFQKLYNQYNSDKVRWKALPIERCFCVKIDTDNIDYSIPPLSGLFESIITLCDIQAAQAEIDELANVKLLYGYLDTLTNTNAPNDFAIDLDLALEFMRKIQDALPEQVAIALSPMKLDTIDFNNDQASDTNVLSKAYSQLIETNGSIVMNSNKITNGTSFRLALQAECLDAMKPIKTITAWINFYLKYNHGVELIGVIFSDVSPYFVSEEREALTKLANLGLPVKMQLASLSNMNSQEINDSDYLERVLLGLGTERWTNSLVSASVQSGTGESGAPKKSDTEIGDEGESSRDKSASQK